MSKCRSCQQEIMFVRTTSGKSMPLDVKPCEGGNIVIDNGVGRVLRAGEPVPAGKFLYRSHFASCVGAAAHRKNRS